VKAFGSRLGEQQILGRSIPSQQRLGERVANAFALLAQPAFEA